MKTMHATPVLSLPFFPAFFYGSFAWLRRRLGWLLLLLLHSPFWAEAQVVDTAAVRREVDSLLNISQTLFNKRDFEKALQVNAIAERLVLASLGNVSDRYDKVCLMKGTIAYYQNNLLEAEKCWLESKNIREKVLGKEHLDYAKILNYLANLYREMRNNEKAEPLFLESLAIKEKALGKEHPDYDASLGNLAILYLTMGNYEKAEQLFLESKAIREKVFGKEHPDYAKSLNNLAVLYITLGNYEKVEPLYLESKAIIEKVLGKEHPDYAKSLSNLANLYHGMGYYEKVEPLHLESMAIREKVLGKEHPEYAESLNNLAILYNVMGEYEKAETLYLECKVIREKVLGKEHPDYAISLNNLAILYKLMGNNEKAEPLYLESKAILERVLGKEHIDNAKPLGNLAILYITMGHYEKAKPVLLESLAILEKVLGKEHPDYATGLGNLAVFYQLMGNHEKAEPLFFESKAIREKVMGKEHPDYAISLDNLATYYEEQSQFSTSDSFLAELYQLDQGRLSKATSYLSERELASYSATFEDRGEMLGAYLLARPLKSRTGTVAIIAFDHALFRKGFLLTAATRLNNLTGASPESQEVNLRLKDYRRLLAAEYSKPIAERKNVAELEEKANAAEKELARTVAGYAEAIRQVSWQEVQSALKNDETAIEFIRFQVNFPKTTDSTMYAVLLLLPGAPAPEFIPLFEERQIQALLPADKAIEDLSKSGLRANYIQSLYAKPALYELLWAPIEKALADKNIKTVYFSPAGILHRMNLGAISEKSGAPPANRYRLVQLGSTRELVTDRNAAKPKPASAVVYGGVQYKMDSTAIAQANRNLGVTAQDTTGGLFRYSPHNSQSGGTRGDDFKYLEGSKAGALHLHNLLQKQGIPSTLRMDYSATEESFKQIGQNGPSPSLLHIGTHGFFFPDPKDTTRRSAVSIGDDAPAFKISEHPLIRSGLLLAGSEYAWKQKHPMPGMEDGILTAHEVSQMNLSNTDLVVLSACETGLGDIKGNEGVYGLQRAFRIAGAKNVLMSLWKVSDDATPLLLNRFYENWLQKGLPVRAALEEAQVWMRGQEKYRNPYFWAGFVLVGE